MEQLRAAILEWSRQARQARNERRYSRLYGWWASAELNGDISRAELFANEIEHLEH